MTTDETPPGPAAPSGPASRAEAVEDHALTPVPAAERRSGWGLMTNTAGIASTLIQLAIGASVTAVAGVGWGILAGVLVAVFGGLLGWGMGHVAHVSGTSSTVTARFYGLGLRGSALASLIFAFMILGFLALENALLYYGTLFMLGWAPTTANAVGIYGGLTVLWILLTAFGLPLVQRTSTVLLVAFVVLTVVLAFVAVGRSEFTLADVLAGAGAPAAQGAAALPLVISVLAGSAGALALVDADFARYARTTRDVGILAVGGAVMIDVVVVVLGTLVLHAGGGVVAQFLTDNPDVAATQGGTTVAEKVAWMAASNSGAYFVVLAGVLGFVLMWVAQAKAQALNTYSGSLALSNLAQSLTGRNPGRLVMVVVGNLVGLAMVAGDILGLIGSYLGLLGVMTTALAGLVIADFFVVRRRVPARPDDLENVNVAGVVSLVVSAVTGGVLLETGVTPLGFLVTLALVLVLYPALRTRVLRPTRPVPARLEEVS